MLLLCIYFIKILLCPCDRGSIKRIIVLCVSHTYNRRVGRITTRYIDDDDDDDDDDYNNYGSSH